MAKHTIEQLKNKIENLKPRNLDAVAAWNKSGAGAHRDDPAKIDPYGRKAKHKKDMTEEEQMMFSVGEKVKIGNDEGTIKVPNGPGDLVGVVMSGKDKITMVKSSKIEKLHEGVLGMTSVDPLFRLKELAGISTSTAAVQENEMQPEMEMHDDFDMNSDNRFDNVEPEMHDEMPAMDAEVEEPEHVEMQPEIEQVPSLGIASELGMPSKQYSEAYAKIEDAIHVIFCEVENVRLGEFKDLSCKLRELSGKVRDMSSKLLTESAKKAAKRTGK